MSTQPRFSRIGRAMAMGAALAIAGGLLVTLSPLGRPLSGLSLRITALLARIPPEQLQPISFGWELLLLVLFGFTFGATIPRLRWGAGLILGIASSAGIVAFACLLANLAYVCWDWLVPVAVQIPAGIVGGIFPPIKVPPGDDKTHLDTPPQLSSSHSKKAPVQAARGNVITERAKRPKPAIAGYELLRRAGRGAYGEVWLGCDAPGKYHAIKIVYRDRFPNDAPYEREFKGLQKYAPFSQLHPGWVQIREMGRNDQDRYFHCVMEAADDEVNGQQIKAESYSPQTLAHMIKRCRWLPLAQCVDLGVVLAAALEHLHQHALIHRDIKPSNVIVVAGAPKFADIGLITDMRTADRSVSYIGTEGYMAPEGPGTAASDIYSLGKLLYEISLGRDRREFPEPATALLGRVEAREWDAMHEILFKACEIQPQRRYQSAAAIHADLVKLQALLGPGSGTGC